MPQGERRDDESNGVAGYYSGLRIICLFYTACPGNRSALSKPTSKALLPRRGRYHLQLFNEQALRSKTIKAATFERRRSRRISVRQFRRIYPIQDSIEGEGAKVCMTRVLPILGRFIS